MSDNISVLALALKSEQYNSAIRQSRQLTDDLGASAVRLTGQTSSLVSTLKTAGAALAGLYAGSRVVGFLRDATNAASAFREDLAQFRHVMRNVRVESEAMLKTLQSDAYGRTAQQAMRMTMNLTSMAKGMGIADAEAMKLSGEFAKLSIDIGSFLAKDPEGVLDAFTSAMMGNTMSLRTYGVFLNETTIKAAILANAKKGMVFATEREARAYALLSESQRQQADAIGDFSVEAQGYNNQVRKLGAGLEELKVKFGKSLLEPARQVAIQMNRFLDALNGMDERAFAVAAGVTVLGTAAVGLYGTFRVAAGVISAVNAVHAIAENTSKKTTVAKTGETAATGALTTAIHAETAAIAANTVARKANVQAATAGGKRGAATGLRKMSVSEKKKLMALDFGENMVDGTVSRKVRGDGEMLDVALGNRRFERQIVRDRVLGNLAANKAARLGGGRAATTSFDLDEFLNKGTEHQQRALVVKTYDRLRKQAKSGIGISETFDVASSVNLSKYMRSKSGLGDAAKSAGLVGFGSLAGIGKNGGMLSDALGKLRGVFGTLNKSTVGWTTNLIRCVPLLGRFATAIAAVANPIGLVVGIGTSIYAFFKAAKHLPYAYEWILDKTEAFQKGLWDFGASLLRLETYVGAIKATGRGIGAVVNHVGTVLGEGAYGLWEIGKRAVGFQTESQKAYALDKAIAERQEQLNAVLEANAKREAEVQAIRVATAESEQKWLEIQEKINEKRNSLATDRHDDIAKIESFRREIETMAAGISGFEQRRSGLAASHRNAETVKFQASDAVRGLDENDPARKEFATLLEKYGGNVAAMRQAAASIKGDDVVNNVLKLINEKRAKDNAAATKAAYGAQMKEYDEKKPKLLELQDKLRQAEFDAIAKIPGLRERRDAYRQFGERSAGAAGSLLRMEFGAGNKAELAAKSLAEQQRIDRLDREIADEASKGQTERLVQLKERREQAAKRAMEYRTGLNQISAFESDVRRCAEEERKIRDEIRKEQEERYKTATTALFDFDYGNASKTERNRIATGEFNRVYAELQKAESVSERERLTKQLKEAYDKIERGEQPGTTWNGVRANTAGAIESGSVQARELQNRIWNDKTIVELTKEMLAVMKQMRGALVQQKRDATAPINVTLGN